MSAEKIEEIETTEEKKGRKKYYNSKLQVIANKKYLSKSEENIKRFKKSSYKSTTKLFIKSYAEKEDIELLKELISEREKILNQTLPSKKQ